jgi:hypothetical protein
LELGHLVALVLDIGKSPLLTPNIKFSATFRTLNRHNHLLPFLIRK